MAIGLTKDAIIAKLQEAEGNHEELINKIAEVIVENNKVLENKIPDLVAKSFTKKLPNMRI